MWMWALVPCPGIEPRPLHWELAVLVPGLPARFLSLSYRLGNRLGEVKGLREVTQ